MATEQAVMQFSRCTFTEYVNGPAHLQQMEARSSQGLFIHPFDGSRFYTHLSDITAEEALCDRHLHINIVFSAAVSKKCYRGNHHMIATPTKATLAPT